MSKIQIIAEIGINHNGDVEIAKKLISIASLAGFDYVKFQKRNPDLCVPEDQKNKPKSTPWGDMTYLDYKYKVEFGEDEYKEIDDWCKKEGIKWFASVWDKDSVDFMANLTDISKIPSALITNDDLLRYARNKFGYLLISTGMSNEDEIVKAVEVGNPDCIMHTNSCYPSPIEDLNLNYITHLKNKYGFREIGYSGHEFGIATTLATVPLGVHWIERHVTLDRTMWGSDQMASIEPHGMFKLVTGIRNVEKALGFSSYRVCSGSELEKRKTLRGE